MMAADIYSKAGADARFLANTPEGRQALASSPEVTSTIAEAIAQSGGGGAGYTDNGDGTITIASSSFVDNGDGTITIGAAA